MHGVAQLAWEGAVPLCMYMHPSEVAASQPPEAAYLLVPRDSYLPLLAEAASAHFQAWLPPGDDTGSTVWFSFEGQPLQWRLPVGVLFDLLAPPLPWRLTAHFRAPFPDGVRCAGPEAVRASLFNSLKVRPRPDYRTHTHTLTLQPR